MNFNPRKRNIVIVISGIWLFLLSFFFINLKKEDVSYIVRVIGSKTYVAGYPIALKIIATNAKKNKYFRVWVKKCEINKVKKGKHVKWKSKSGVPAILSIQTDSVHLGSNDIRLELSVEGKIRELGFSINIKKCGKECGIKEQLKLQVLRPTQYVDKKAIAQNQEITIQAFPRFNHFSAGFPQTVWFIVKNSSGKPSQGYFIIEGHKFKLNSAGFTAAQVNIKQMSNHFSYLFQETEGNNRLIRGNFSFRLSTVSFDVSLVGAVTLSNIKKGYVLNVKKRKWTKSLYCDLYLGDTVIFSNVVTNHSIELPNNLTENMYYLECNEHYLIKSGFNAAQHFLVVDKTNFRELLNIPVSLINNKEAVQYAGYLLNRLELPYPAPPYVIVSTENSDTKLLKHIRAEKRKLITLLLSLSFCIILLWAVLTFVFQYRKLKQNFEQLKQTEQLDEIDSIGRKNFFLSFAIVFIMIIIDAVSFIWLLYFMSTF